MKTELSRQQELVTEVVLLCQLINYRLDELEPCIFKNDAKKLLQNLIAQSGKIDKIVNTFTTRLEGGEDQYQYVANGLDIYFKKLHDGN